MSEHRDLNVEKEEEEEEDLRDDFARERDRLAARDFDLWFIKIYNEQHPNSPK
jgi:hypothetical protein